MDKPICLITGATEGVGRFTAFKLARKGFTVVMAARNQRKAELVKAEIASVTGGDVDYIIADLASLKDVRLLAQTFQGRYLRLDVLINNAGIFAPERRVTADGFETSYQINYLSHFLLTQLLLDDLKSSPQGRIINLSSSVYTAGRFDPDNLQSEKKFSVLTTYSSTKLFMLLFTIELAKRLQGTRITANAVHPGIARTQMMLRAPGMFKVISFLALPFSVSPNEGAATSVYLASSPDVKEVSGKYFTNMKPAAFKTKFNTDALCELLWKISVQSLRHAEGGHHVAVDTSTFPSGWSRFDDHLEVTDSGGES
jgi:NAD(P)-dependent dehydrogenase (short-subunit alcohol dehydrogenase family)